MNNPAPRRAVYTAIFGGYEKLNDIPAEFADGITYICFTDDPETTSEVWDVRLVEPRFAMDFVRSARHYKLRGDESLAGFDETLWLDNTVGLHVHPNEILDAWLADADIAMPLHSYRYDVAAEFEQIAAVGYDDPTRVYEQLQHYLAIAPEVLDQRPFWTALLARRNTAAVRAFGDLWMDHVLRYSRRDQLSVNFVAAGLDLDIAAIAIDNFNSDLHSWPVPTDRKWGLRPSRFQEAMRPDRAEIGRLRNAYDELEAAMNDVVLERDRQIEETEQHVESTSEEVARLRHELDELRASTSWRVTAGLRKVRSIGR